jgi:hypothetical protein
MPSHLNSESTPDTVTSGTSFLVTITYESTSNGDIALGVDAGFTISPTKYPVTASSPGSAMFNVTITRTTGTSKGCTVTYTFGNVLAPKITEVK